MRLLVGASPPLFAAAAGIQLVLAGLPVAITACTAVLIASLATTLRDESTAAIAWMSVLVVVLIALHLGRGLLSAGATHLITRLGRRAQAEVQARVLAATAAPVGIGHLEDEAVLTRLERVKQLGDGRGNASQGLESLRQRATSAAGAVLSALVVATWSPAMAVALLIGFLLLNRWSEREYRRLTATQVEQTPDLRHAEAIFTASTSSESAKEVRVFDVGAYLVSRYSSSWQAAMEPVWRSRRGVNRGFLGVSLLEGAITAGALTTAVASARVGDLGLAKLLLVVQNINSMRALSSLNAHGVVLNFIAERAPVLRDLEAELVPPVDRGQKPSMPGGEIRFEGVGFSYPGQSTPVFEHLDLVIEPRRSLAIVGVNGAGKSTLVKLLARLYDPTVGRITVDGTDLRDLDARQWQQRVAAVFQDFTHFDLSLADNVGFGAPALAHDRASLDLAAVRAGASALVEQLPLGWDTPLSPRITGGVDLSGGQWQRVALARALLAVQGGGDLLVLDEPAAALDVRAEADLVRQLLEAASGVTTIVISHRFSTVRRCDRIVVLDEGTVVEDGNHDSLMAAGGHYSRLFQLQARPFQDSSTRAEPIEAGSVIGLEEAVE